MSRRAISRARRRCTAEMRAYDWTLTPGEWNAAHVTPEFDACRYDDILRPALRVRATLVLDDDGEPAGLTDVTADRSLS